MAGSCTLGVSTYENFYPYSFAGLGGLYVLTVFGMPLSNVGFVESLVTPIPAATVLFSAGVVGLGALRHALLITGGTATQVRLKRPPSNSTNDCVGPRWQQVWVGNHAPCVQK